MRQFGKIELSNQEYERLVKSFIRFYKNETKCSGKCPVDIGMKWTRKVFEKIDSCFCHVLPMFPDNDCPCHEMKEKAFIALEEFIRQYGKEFM